MEHNICCICGKEFAAWGNNPWPIIQDSDSVCCDECNLKVVIPERIRRITERASEEYRIECRG